MLQQLKDTRAEKHFSLIPRSRAVVGLFTPRAAAVEVIDLVRILHTVLLCWVEVVGLWNGWKFVGVCGSAVRDMTAVEVWNQWVGIWSEVRSLECAQPDESPSPEWGTFSDNFRSVRRKVARRTENVDKGKNCRPMCWLQYRRTFRL